MPKVTQLSTASARELADISCKYRIAQSRKHVGQAVRVTGRGGPWSCELWLTHFLDNPAHCGSYVASLTCWPSFTSRNIPGIHSVRRLSKPQGYSAAGSIRSIEKSNYLIGNRTQDLPACTIVSEPTDIQILVGKKVKLSP
jgi:hypothetical protein